MTQADAPTGHRWGSLGDVPDPLRGDEAPLFSVDNSGSLPLNHCRLSSFGFASGLLEVYFSSLSVCLCDCSYCLC